MAWGPRFTQTTTGDYATAYMGVTALLVTVEVEDLTTASTYLFEVIGAPSASTYGAATPDVPIVLAGSGLSRTFTPDEPGTYVVRVTASDASGLIVMRDTRVFACPDTLGNVFPDVPWLEAQYNFPGAPTGTMRMAVETSAELSANLGDNFDLGATLTLYDDANPTGATLSSLTNAAVLNQVTKSPTGFPNRTDSLISRDDGLRTFYVTPSGVSFDMWYRGEKITKSTQQSVTWTDSEGLWYFYFNGSGVLTSTQNFNTWVDTLLGDGILVATLYWDATNNASILFCEERHGFMPPDVHLEMHEAFGARWIEGGSLGDFLADGTGNDDANARLSVEDVTIYDEDIRLEFTDGSPQVLDPIALLPGYYRDGASGVWRKATADSFPVIYSGKAGYVGANGRLPFNEWTGAVWQLTEADEGNYVLSHIFTTNDVSNPVIFIQGTAQYTTLSSAASGGYAEIIAISSSMVLMGHESVALGTVVFQTSAGYGNTPKARIVSSSAGPTYVDIRGIDTHSPWSVGIMNHGLLFNLAADSHTQYLLASGARALSGNLDVGSNAITNVTTVDGVDVSAHASRHASGGADALASPMNLITVSGTGATYTDLNLAITAANAAASAATPQVVRIYPGVYTAAPFTIASYVSVVGGHGTSIYSTILQTSNNAAHFITGSDNAELTGVSIIGPTDPGFAAIYYSDASYVPFVISFVTIRRGYYGLWCHNAASDATVHAIFVANHYDGQPIENFMRVTGHGRLMAMNCAPTSGAPGAIVTGFYASGPDTKMSLDYCSFRSTTGTAVYVNDGAIVRLIGCAVAAANIGLHVGGTWTGTDTKANASACTFHRDDVTTHIRTDTTHCLVTVGGGTLNTSKVTLAADSTLVGLATRTTTGTEGSQAYGDMYVGTDSFPMISYVKGTSSSGLVSGGVVSVGVGLHVDYTSGVGVISTTPTTVAKVSWAGGNLDVGANEHGWVVFDSAGLVQKTLSEPTYTTNSPLGEYVTNGAGVVFLQSESVNLHQAVAESHEYLESVVGPICVSGSTVTKHAGVSLEVDVTDGVGYITNLESDFDSATPASFIYWRRDGSGGWISSGPVTAFDPEHYDLNNLIIDHVPAGEYTRHLMFVTESGTGTAYHVVYGQQSWAAAISAVNNPICPSWLTTRALRIVAVILQQGTVDINSLVDQRPMLGQLAPTTTSVTVHNDLTGRDSLTAHVQYQLGSEKGAPLGYAGLDAAGLVDPADLPISATPGENVSADPPVAGSTGEVSDQGHTHQVLTGNPVSIGTSNQPGVLTTLALADHIHNHDNQAGGTLHAAASGAAAGFMSAAHYTKLENGTFGLATGLKTATTTVVIDGAAAPALGDALVASSDILATWVSVVPSTRTVSTSNGLTGGGALSGNLSLQPVYGTIANTVCQGNDSRLSDQRVASKLGTTGADVTVNTAAPPTLDQVLKATGATSATWQTHKGGFIQSVTAALAVDATQTGTTYADPPLVTTTLTTGVGFLLINFTASGDNTNNGRGVHFRVLVDGVAIRGSGYYVNSAGSPSSTSITARVAVTAGSHTVKVQWKTTANTARIRPVTNPDFDHAALVVSEVIY